MRLASLLSALPSPPDLQPADPDITAVVSDSRQVASGALFVAIRGETHDGHRFIPEALQRGAAAIVVEGKLKELQETRGHSRVPSVPIVRVPNSREALAYLSAAWQGFPARSLVMIGVTGTDDKTTTANLIYSILSAAGLKAGLISTVNAVIGDQTVDTGFHVTTPEAPAIQGYLRQMVDGGLTHCVLEATSHGLAQERVAACEFDLAVLTNVTHEHLDYHGAFEEYRLAKTRLFDFLGEGRRDPKGVPAGPPPAAILNRDDPSYDFFAARLAVPHFTYSLGPAGDLTASGIAQSRDGLSFELTGSGVSFRVRTSLLGRYNVSNCLAAAAVGLFGLGLSPRDVQEGAASFPGVPGRMERVELGQPFAALVDFAHTPNALRNALTTAREIAGLGGRVIAIFGSAGLRDRAKRHLMAEVSTDLADVTILTAEDPRTESLSEILEEMAEGCRGKGGVEGERYWKIEDRGEAIRFGVGLARPADVVIACGKGHEQTMCFGETEYPWDDRGAMRAALAERLGVAGPAMPWLPTA